MKLKKSELESYSKYESKDFKGFLSISNTSSLVVLDIDDDSIVTGYKIIDREGLFNIAKNHLFTYKDGRKYFIRSNAKFDLDSFSRFNL